MQNSDIDFAKHYIKYSTFILLLIVQNSDIYPPRKHAELRH